MTNSAKLRVLLDIQRTRLYRTRLVLMLTTLAALAGTALLTYLVLDAALLLPDTVYWLFRTAFLLAAGYGLYQVMVNWRRPLSDPAVARLLEEESREPRNRLVNAAFFLGQPAEAGEPLAESVLDGYGGQWPRLRHGGLVPEPALRRLGWVVAGLAVVLGVAILHDTAGTTSSLARLFLFRGLNRVPVFTTIVRVLPGDVTVVPGADLDVVATVAGPRPESVMIDVREAHQATDSRRAYPVHAATDAPTPAGEPWECPFREVFQPFQYRVVAGTRRSPWYTVRVATPPALTDWNVRVEPPAYTGQVPFTVDRKTAGQGIVTGSRLRLTGEASGELREVQVRLGNQRLAFDAELAAARFEGRFSVTEVGKVSLTLVSRDGLEGTFPLPLVVVPDGVPTIALVDTAAKIKLAAVGNVGIGFRADDDWGLGRVGIEVVQPDGKTVDLDTQSPPAGDAVSRSFSGRILLDAARLTLMPGRSARVRLFAEDRRPGAGQRRGYSGSVEIALEELTDKAKERQQQVQNAGDYLSTIIRLQQENLGGTRRLLDTVASGRSVATGPVRGLQEVQVRILEGGRALLGKGESLGDLRVPLTGLVEEEMVRAVDALAQAVAGGEAAQREALGGALELEKRILAVLTGAKDGLAAEAAYQDRKDLFALFRQLVARQQKNLQETVALDAKAPPPARCRSLATTQDQLAVDLTGFREQSAAVIAAPMKNDDFAARLRDVCDLLDRRQVFTLMVTAAEQLEERELPAATTGQRTIVAALLEALDVLNRWNAQQAQQVVEKAGDVLKEVAAALDKLEKDQARIAETTHELARTGKLDDQTREKLRQMDKEQEAMADLVEELAQDLCQFPELPVCNELNSLMREIFEDVEQAAGSADAPAIEIAVQKEDALLDAIRAAKERVEDVEMWLPSVPDNIAWNMESFDADEFPDMPLVPLPEELEDIVGNLLEQAEDIAQQAQDSTGNNMMADGEMGWDITDGPMPNFSAKGKSGNTRPNDNEMTGRSGAGREGQSNGEMVEGSVKGLEGTETHARYTRDPLQKGQASEADDSTLKARSTGGGKLGGTSESVGLFGKAPRRDLGMPEHGTSLRSVRQEAEAIYSKARLLYLDSGNLGRAADTFRTMESADSVPAFATMGRKVVRFLQDSQVEVDTGTVLAMRVDAESAGGGGMSQWDFDLSRIADDDYRDMVRSFFRGLDAAPVPE